MNKINMIEVFKDKDEKNYWSRLDKKQKSRTPYKLKLYAIQNSLYGVDIEPSAIDITKLRLWLSILVDSTNTDVRPLPNLDFNFMIGNSLIDEFEGMKLFDESLLDDKVLEKKLKKIKKAENMKLFRGIEEEQQDILKEIFVKQSLFFNENNSNKKKELKNDIEELENNLIKLTLTENGNHKKLEEIEKGRKERRKPYFLWKLEFAKVFKENGGFDIVIGNPPYIRYEKIKSDREIYEKNYKCFFSSVDIYILFYELGYNLLKENGTLVYITSNKWMKAKYGIEFRKFLLDKTKIKILIDLEENIFESASVDTSIILFEKYIEKNYILNVSTKVGEYIRISINQFSTDLFFILPPIVNNLKNKIEKKGELLKDKKYKIRRGILTGCNEGFIIDKDLYKKFQKNKQNLKIIFPVLKGKDIEKYKINFKKIYILATKNDLDIEKEFPEIYDYLNKKNKELKDALVKRYDKGKHWTNLRNCAYYEEFFKEKIVYPEFSSSSSFSWESGEYFNLDTTWFISGEVNKALLGILNSKLIWFYLKIISVQLGKNAVRMKKIYLDKLPIISLTKKEERNIEIIVDEIIELKKINKDTQDLEEKIDEMVYELYGLTEEEKELIRNFK